MTASPDWRPNHWNVVFMRSLQPSWFQRLDWRRDFGHCEAFTRCPRSGRWLVVAPHTDLTIICTLNDQEFRTYQRKIAERDALILIAPVLGKQAQRPAFIATCATVISSLIGLPGLGAVRPYALYRKLRRIGATEIPNGQRIRRRGEGSPARHSG